MRTRISMLALVVFLAVAATRPVRAGYATPFEDIAFQQLTADMTVATLGQEGGFDPATAVTYTGTYNQSGWNGTFGGTYMGQPVTGTSDAMVTGDPNWSIMGGAKWMGSDTLIDLTLVESTTTPGTFTLRRGSSTGGKFKSYWSGSLTETISPEGTDTLMGTLTESHGGRLTYWVTTISVDLLTGEITSKFQETTGPRSRVGSGPIYKDKGSSVTVQQVALGDFQGTMTDVVTVPEPSALAHCGASAVLGLGYWLCRRPRRKPVERERH